MGMDFLFYTQYGNRIKFKSHQFTQYGNCIKFIPIKFVTDTQYGKQVPIMVLFQTPYGNLLLPIMCCTTCMGMKQLPLFIHSQQWNSLRIPMLDKVFGWEFYKTQTKESNIFSCDYSLTNAFQPVFSGKAYCKVDFKARIFLEAI